MPAPKMHEGEVEVDEALAARLIKANFPQWADLPVRAVQPWGTDNAIFRLGDEMMVRLPRVAWAKHQVEKEQRWLPVIAPLVPNQVPRPLAKGSPGEGYPWAWSVYSWLKGDAVEPEMLANPDDLAMDLGEFVSALQAIDATGGPLAGLHNFGRGLPLSDRDQAVRKALAALSGEIDVDAASQAWAVALAAPVWERSPVWIHGDLQANNLLLNGERLGGVIDFGGLGVGDPACDLMVAWTLFSGSARQRYRETLQADDATWARGKGWALSAGLIALPYYLHTNPTLVASSRRAITEVLAG